MAHSETPSRGLSRWATQDLSFWTVFVWSRIGACNTVARPPREHRERCSVKNTDLSRLLAWPFAVRRGASLQAATAGSPGGAFFEPDA